MVQYEILANSNNISQNVETDFNGRVSIKSISLNDTFYMYEYPVVRQCVVLDISPEFISVWVVEDDGDKDNFDTIDVESDGFVDLFVNEDDCISYSEAY